MLTNPAIQARFGNQGRSNIGIGSFLPQLFFQESTVRQRIWTPTKHGLHARQRSRSDARRVPSCRCQLRCPCFVEYCAPGAVECAENRRLVLKAELHSALQGLCQASFLNDPAQPQALWNACSRLLLPVELALQSETATILLRSENGFKYSSGEGSGILVVSPSPLPEVLGSGSAEDLPFGSECHADVPAEGKDDPVTGSELGPEVPPHEVRQAAAQTATMTRRLAFPATYPKSFNTGFLGIFHGSLRLHAAPALRNLRRAFLSHSSSGGQNQS